MNFRRCLAIVFGLSILIPLRGYGAGTSSLGSAGLTEERKAVSRSAGPQIYGQRKIIEFTEPPLTLEQPVVTPPPAIPSLRSDPKLRAANPPNQGAATVSESFREKFGKLVEYNFTLSGPDEELLVRRATADALLSVAARVYYLDRILLSQDLLPLYLEQNGDKFLRRIHVGERGIHGGQPIFGLQLIVDQDALMADLEEKRFISRPKIRPFFFAFLDQRLNGAPDKEERGRKAVEEVMKDRNIRYAEHGVPSMANPDVDLTSSPELLNEGRRAAQRNEIEAAVTGSMVTRPTDLESPVNEYDWAHDTVSVTLEVPALQKMFEAHLPVSLLVSKLEETFKTRKEAGQREWWDVPSVEVEVPLDSLEKLGASEREALEKSGLPKAVVSARRIGYQRNYYTGMFYYSTRFNMKLMRVDNGGILAETRVDATGSDAESERSIQTAIAQAVNEGANRLLDEFYEVWDMTVLDKADFKIIASHVSEAETKRLVETIRTLDSKAEVNIRSHLGDVAVLTVNFPKGKDSLVKAITSLNDPRFRLVTETRNAVEIEQL